MTNWIPAIIAVLTCITTVILAYGYLKFKVEQLSKSEDDIKKALEDSVKDLREILTKTTKELADAVNLLRVSAAEQAVINKFTTGLLTSLTGKVEANTKDINEHSMLIGLIKELLNLQKERGV